MSIISWCDEAWNPIIGCSHVSSGCDHCPAERMAHRQIAMGNYQSSIHDGYGWTGRTVFRESELDKPRHWKRPRVVLVCSMGDLFHESVEYLWFCRVMSVMLEANQHTYMLLTKRPDCMREFMSRYCDRNGFYTGIPSNVVGMVTAEDQQRADERIPILLDTAFAYRGVSIEPMIGPVNIDRWVNPQGYDCSCGHSVHYAEAVQTHETRREIFPVCEDCGELATWIGYDPRLDFVIVVGESGPGARPMQPEWIRGVRGQCVASGVGFHFKQWGDNAPVREFCGTLHDLKPAKKGGNTLDGETYPFNRAWIGA